MAEFRLELMDGSEVVVRADRVTRIGADLVFQNRVETWEAVSRLDGACCASTPGSTGSSVNGLCVTDLDDALTVQHDPSGLGRHHV